MSEEPTDRLNGEHTFQQQVLAGLAAINDRLTSIENRLTSVENRMASLEGRVTALENRFSTIDSRLTALEEKVDARLRETRPIWEAVQSQLKLIDSKLNVFSHEWLELKGEVELLKKGSPPL
ncbi:MAG TPA: hypothetical protein VK422_18570 [Pyrinomonadaceae bacterium]|nr:hypothetical protein [Pyrinomonadaceae bacterium]